MKRLDDAKCRALSVRASVDPRTLQKVLRGERVRGMAEERARAVLEEAGLLPRKRKR